MSGWDDHDQFGGGGNSTAYDENTPFGESNGFENPGGFDDANGFNNAGAGNDTACRNCGQEGHFSKECTEPRKMGACFNCGEEGHAKVDCTKPRVFTGTCRECNETGHRASDCPKKPKKCAICKEENTHDTVNCENNYAFDLSTVPDLSEDECWAAIKKASNEIDMDDFKEAIQALQKACPQMTYVDIEKQLRARQNRFYIIGLEKEIGTGYTNVNLQGEINKTYSVSFYKSPDAPRPIMVAKWPKDTDDNLTRLADAGKPLQRGLPYCNNCEKHGHRTKQCDQDFVAPEQVKIMCALCGEEGHRVRDCTQERRKPREPRTCKNCGSEDHIAKECDQPRKVTCRNCDEEGHMAKDCEKPRKLICNNCEKEGHISKECTEPKDWSKVTCRHCGEKGHASESRCAPGAVKLNQVNDNQDTANGDSGFDAGGHAGGDAGGADWNNGSGDAGGHAGGGDWNASNDADDWNSGKASKATDNWSGGNEVAASSGW